MMMDLYEFINLIDVIVPGFSQDKKKQPININLAKEAYPERIRNCIEQKMHEFKPKTLCAVNNYLRG